jgi:hypothetical protein
LPGWGESYGVQHEIDVFRAAGKPIHYIEPFEFGVADLFSTNGFRLRPSRMRWCMSCNSSVAERVLP